MTGIFKITNTLNNKVYIGSGKDAYARYSSIIKNGSGTKKVKLYVEEMIGELGEDNFEMSILETVKDNLKLPQRKTYWINKFNSDITGYNRMRYIKASEFKMEFGKHIDNLYSDIPLSYFRWLATQEWVSKEKPKLLRRLKLYFQLVKEGNIVHKNKN